MKVRWKIGIMVLWLLSTFLLMSTPTEGKEHYSYELAEKLKPLIQWRDYGPKAFKEAAEQNKPIFLLLTAPSWCYWCQVYESEEYLFHPDIVKYINEHFIPIYVDADKRRDLTRQYLEGGWPSTTVMTPSGERLFGFSGPRPVLNMLANLQQAVLFVQQQGFVSKITYHYQKTTPLVPTATQLNTLLQNYASIILRAHDEEYGGFGTGQKFPQGRTLDFALELYEKTGDKQWLKLVYTTLKNQYTKKEEIEMDYNLFDPIEGGFHRYGTQRDWTPPHYEKMLYDNARLLKAYAHLLQITPEEVMVKEVVEKTLRFMEQQLYDNKNGGFYSNVDAHGEEAYYGKVERPKEKPRVEKTKYTDWNSEAMLTYLYLWQTTKKPAYKATAEQTLAFFAKEMITEQGAYHYQAPTGEKGVRGSLLDNAYLLLAFVEGNQVLDNPTYLETAEQLAHYLLENLYDWYGGGFFERNSPDTELYAPAEHLNLAKPSEENGIIAYALLQLYEQTKNPLYLHTAVKTLGARWGDMGGLDRGYYYTKAAQLLLESNLLVAFEEHREEMEKTEREKQKSFWLNALLEEPQESFKASDEGVEKPGGPFFLLLLVALIAGFISFASPCTLPILPAYLAYAFQSSKQNIKTMTLAFFLGLSIVFTLLGMSATLIGNFLKTNLTLFSQIAGIAIMFLGVMILFKKGFPGFRVKQKKPTTYAGSFLFGAALGISWTPCVGPILVAVLLLASTTSSAFTGGFLLLVYAIGLAIPLILVSLYLQKTKERKIWNILQGKELQFGNRTIHSNTLISGVLFIVLGYLIFSGILYAFNQYVVATSFQKWLFGIEEWLLAFL